MTWLRCFAVAAISGEVAGWLFHGPQVWGYYFLAIGLLACVWVWRVLFDWSELRPDRRRVAEPVQRERRRRDYEVGR